MFLFLELLFVALLVIILFMLYANERLSKKNHLPSAKVEEYWAGQERRKYVRFKKTLEVKYIVEKKAHLLNHATTVDISEGGMKLLLDEKLNVAAILDLKVTIPNSKEIAELEGEVVWTEDVKDFHADKRYFRSGIKFIAMSEPSGKLLIDYIHSIATSTAA